LHAEILKINLGSDTTGMALSAAFFYLLHSPEALIKASQEVRSHFSSVEEIRVGSQLNACKYLHACLKEALRMSPSVTGLAPREVLAGGLTIDENHFPQGVTIGTPIYTIHHNEAYFPEPFIYRPERWIVHPDKDYTEESVRLAQSAFCPFSIGSRSCVAKNLAWMEISITLARTLYMYDMRLSPKHAHKPSEGCISPTKKGHGFEYLLKGWMTSARLGPRAQFRRVREMNGTHYVI
jgi:cytochrome P450